MYINLPSEEWEAGGFQHYQEGQGRGRERDRGAATNEGLEELGLFTKARKAAGAGAQARSWRRSASSPRSGTWPGGRPGSGDKWGAGGAWLVHQGQERGQGAAHRQGARGALIHHQGWDKPRGGTQMGKSCRCCTVPIFILNLVKSLLAALFSF